MSQTFCPLPWNFQAIRANGDLRVCCQSNVTASRGVLKKSSTQSFNAGSDCLDDARNSETLKDVRRSILKGEWNPNCTRCEQEEKAGLNSRRRYEGERWNLSLNDVKAFTDDTGHLDIEKQAVVYYDLRFGNLCNLKCRMCGPSDSSAWYDDWVSLMGKDSFKDTHGLVKLEKSGDRFKTADYDWHYSESFWQQLESKLDRVQYIYMAGGEPLLIKKHYDFLEKCVARDVASAIILEYNTNCTQLPEKVLKLWAHFKGVRVGASIDGFGPVFEYQRFPAQWNQVYQNLQTLNKQPESILSWMAFTVTAYNIFHMTDFMKWKLQDERLKNINRTQHRPIISPHVAHHPKFLNIRALPAPLKERVERNFRDFCLWLRSEDFAPHVQAQGDSIASSIISYMREQDYHESFWQEFCSYTFKLDQIRGQKLLDICPEYEGFYQPAT